jgi:UDP-glucuronate 4-epimerase
MYKILLTGGAGFIGTRLKEKLIEEGFEVLVYDLIDGNDICDKYKLDNFVNKEKPRMIINLAAKAGVPMGEEYYEEFFRTNCIGLKTVIDVCKKHNVKLVHFSSSSCLKAQSVYGITKLAGEKLIEASGIEYLIIRPFTVIGENGRKEMVLYKWLGQYLRGEKISFYGLGDTFRGYTYIGDLVEGVDMSLDISYKTLNIGGNQKVTLDEFWGIFKEVFPEAEREMLPLPSYDITGEMADISETTKLTGWTPQTDIKLKIKELLQNEQS